MDNLYINIERLFLIFYNDIGGQFYSVHLGFLSEPLMIARTPSFGRPIRNFRLKICTMT
jgi:hypothetical protein